MRFRIPIVAIAGAFAALASVASAQQYGTHTPIPKSTSLPALRASAQAREVKTRFAIGLAADAQNDWANAAPEFERILQLMQTEPEHSTAAYDLARAYAGLHRYDEAAQSLKAAIAGDPQFLAAYANLISVDLLRGNLSEARTYANRFVALAPDSARALYSRGLAALQSNDGAAAIADFGKLLQSNPSYAVAHYDLGIAETQISHIEEAQREFETAVRLAPSYARAQFALATVLLKEGRRPQARVALEAAIRDSQSDPALHNLATALRDEIK